MIHPTDEQLLSGIAKALKDTVLPELARGSLKDAALSALKILLWAKLKGTKDGAIEFTAVPADLAAIKEKLGAESLEYALLDRKLLGQPIAYRIPSAEELGL